VTLYRQPSRTLTQQSGLELEGSGYDDPSLVILDVSLLVAPGQDLEPGHLTFMRKSFHQNV